MAKSSTKARTLVVIPTLGKRNDLLRLTLESVKQQHPHPFDIVMVFPLDNFETAKLAKEYSAATVQDPGGLSAAVNAGIASAKQHHEFISWIGDDDLINPNSLATASKALDDNPKATVAYGYCDYIDENGKIIFTSKAGNLAPWIMKWGPNLMPCPGSLFRKSSLDQAGTFDENNKYSMDLDMFLRLHKIGPFVNTKRALASFRWHADSTTVANRKVVLKETEAVKHNHLPKYLRPFAPLWDIPVRYATIAAAHRVSNLAKKRS